MKILSIIGFKIIKTETFIYKCNNSTIMTENPTVIWDRINSNINIIIDCYINRNKPEKETLKKMQQSSNQIISDINILYSILEG